MRALFIPLTLAVPANAQSSRPPADAIIAAPSPPIVMTNSPPPPVIYIPPESVRLTPPLAPERHIVRPPQERRSAQSLIGVDDYPASALANREEGRVGFALEVAPNGRVAGCSIVRSSGSSALDHSTCRLMRSRARFTPAMDNTGSPVTGVIEQEVTWQLPAR